MRIPFFLTTTLCLLALTACQTSEDAFVAEDDLALSFPSFIVDENEDGHTGLPARPELQEAFETHTDNMSADYFDAERVEITRPDGTTDVRYVIEGDIELTKDELRMLQSFDASLEKQYRTNNLVTDNFITIIGYTGSPYNLTSKMRTGLQWAVDNYNAINTDITFSLSFTTSTNADIVVYRDPNNQAGGGVAGFPANGAPYKWVRIYNGMENFDFNTNEHVMVHEIGHCMGLRHTDWFDKSGCGRGPESAGSTGAVHIPGTPTTIDVNSMMISCFTGNGEDGEFGFYDVVALEYLY